MNLKLASEEAAHEAFSRIERVISIVGSSRSGSSVFKWCMEQHPDICSLAGEEEPYYKIAGNGWPNHKSDEFHQVNGDQLIRRMIGTELLNHESEFNRWQMQQLDIEERPFVEAKECRITPTLLLKTPQNVYRRGVIEQLFPGRQVDYVFITRNFAASMNGLMDGWLHPINFNARRVGDGWWCFDMPPGWDKEETTVFGRTLHQWLTANRYGLTDYPDAVRVQFENWQRGPLSSINRVFYALGMSTLGSLPEVPHVMTTAKPEVRRWEKRRSLLLSVAPRVEKVMSCLGYDMDERTWL